MITGGSSGIGRALSFLLAKNGASVISIGKTKSHLEETSLLHPNINTVQCDLSKTGEIERLFEKIRQIFSHINGFVHSAGIIYTEPFKTFRMYELREMERVNVESGFELLQKILPLFDEGSIVFVSSIDAFFEAVERASSGYALSKAATLGLVKALASELGKRNIRVNAVVPGLIRTQMTEDFFEDEFNKKRKRFLERVPLNRAGRASEVAKLILFLLSDESSYITGDSIFIDGGYHIR